MMINIRLYGILRDRLPAAQKGRTTVHLHEGESVADLLAYLDISRRVEVAVNEEVEIDESQILNEGDLVHIFTSISGG